MTGEPFMLIEPRSTPVPAAELASRLAGLQAVLAARGLDAALITQNADLYYFAGTVQQSYLYVPATGEAVLFVGRTLERARVESALEGVEGLPAIADLPRLIRRRYGGLPARVGLELDVLPVTRFRRLERLLPEAAFEDVGRDIVRQRAVKSLWEIERVRAAAAVADEVCAFLPGVLREGLTEVEFAGIAEAEARRLGHEGHIRMRGFNQEMFYGQLLAGTSGVVPSYPDTPLAGTGLSPAVAQGPSFRRIGRGEPVVFDFVPVRDGYIADFTRLFVVGEASGEVHRAYDAALRVQAAAVLAALPGVPCRQVWEAARTAAADAGMLESFMGRGVGQVPYVGHGVGLELDELPVLTGSGLELAEGMVFALEPKFVLPGVGAVGVENTWVVTGDGPVRLTRAPESLYEVAVGATS